MCGELNTDRRIHMSKISLFAVSAALILAGLGAWAASTTYGRVEAAAVVGVDPVRVDPVQIMRNATDLPTVHFADYTFVFIE
jgi:hypothetical protein